MKGVPAGIASLLLIATAGCGKMDSVAGTYKGVEHVTAFDEKMMAEGGVSADVENGLKAKMAKTEGTLIINGDGTTSFSTNLSANVDAGKWVRRKDGYIVIDNGEGEEDWKPGPGGRSLSFRNWILGQAITD